MAPSDPSTPALSGVFETVLYADAVPETARFFQIMLGLSPLRPPTQNAAIFRLNSESMLLIFDPNWSEQSGRGAPTHGSRGPGHIALRIPGDSYEAWKAKLSSLNIPIETEVNWEHGGRSIYLRDPAGNSIELAAGDVWGS